MKKFFDWLSRNKEYARDIAEWFMYIFGSMCYLIMLIILHYAYKHFEQIFDFLASKL